MDSPVRSIKHLKNNDYQPFWNYFKKEREEGSLSNSFYETSITLLPKPNKDTTRKLQTNILTDIDMKILNKTLANWI